MAVSDKKIPSSLGYSGEWAQAPNLPQGRILGNEGILSLSRLAKESHSLWTFREIFSCIRYVSCRPPVKLTRAFVSRVFIGLHDIGMVNFCLQVDWYHMTQGTHRKPCGLFGVASPSPEIIWCGQPFPNQQKHSINYDLDYLPEGNSRSRPLFGQSQILCYTANVSQKRKAA